MMEERNEHDPYCNALVLSSTSQTVGHIPREISGFTHFFLKHGGTIHANVIDTRWKRSPIEQGGLEILIIITAKHKDSELEQQFRGLTAEHHQRYESYHLSMSSESHSRIWTAPKRKVLVIDLSDSE